MKKLIAIVALAGCVLATPALAQSYSSAFGTGNVLPFAYSPQHRSVAAAQRQSATTPSWHDYGQRR